MEKSFDWRARFEYCLFDIRARLWYKETSARGASSPRKGQCPPIDRNMKVANLLSA